MQMPLPSLEDTMTLPLPGEGLGEPVTATVVEFTVLGNAAPAGSKKAFVHPKTGRAIVTDANSKVKPWQSEVRAEAAGARPGPFLLQGPLRVEMRFFRPRPQGHYGARGNLLPSAPAMPFTRPDVLKLARGVEDACTDALWRDDAQIVEEFLVKAFGEPARCVVRVVALEPQPEWDGRVADDA